MANTGNKSILVLLVSLLLVANVSAGEETKAEHDNSRLAVFAQGAISFLDFEERQYFQNAIDTIYADFRAQAVDAEESLYVAKQNFQKVNFCFPIMGGIQYQVREDHFISAGIGYIYDNESVVLTDRKNKPHNYSYTIQGVPAFLEYRLNIPTSLITLSNGGLFSLALRWYWTLPGTEIYTTWGMLEAENKPWGAGFGVSLGYLVASWNGLNVYGDIGYSTISVKSEKTFADIVPNGPDEKAKWNIGGLQLQIRLSLGVINKPKAKVEEKTEATKNAEKKTPGTEPKPATKETAPAEAAQAETDTKTEAKTEPKADAEVKADEGAKAEAKTDTEAKAEK